MKVTLATHGGQAAALHRRLPPEVLDSDDLSEDAAAELARLVAAAFSDAAPGTSGPGRARDAVSYTITVEDGGQSTVLTQSDTTMSPAFAVLLSWLEQHFAQS
jgi:hypothetical protein